MKIRSLARSCEARGFSTMATSILVVGVASILGSLWIMSETGTNCRVSSLDLSAAKAIESAFRNFEMEYGRSPVSDSHFRTDTADGVNMLSVLLGLEPESPQMRNTRQINFLSLKETKTRKRGLLYDSSGMRVEGLFDSWGHPYVVHVNLVAGRPLRFTYGSKVVELPGKSVAVYSVGPDGKAGTNDDIRSWDN